jgi:hypothetical protein
MTREHRRPSTKQPQHYMALSRITSYLDSRNPETTLLQSEFAKEFCIPTESTSCGINGDVGQ